MLGLKIAKISPIMISTVVKFGGKTCSAMPPGASTGKTVLQTWNLQAVGHKNFLISKPTPSFVGNVNAIRFGSNEPSLPGPKDVSKVRLYWELFLKKKEKFEDDVDQFLAPWPRIRQGRLRFIARMQAVRGRIFQRIKNAIFYVIDINVRAITWTKVSFDRRISKAFQPKNKEIMNTSPDKEHVDSSFNRMIGFLWDTNNWMVFSAKTKLREDVKKNTKTGFYWTEMSDKIEKPTNSPSLEGSSADQNSKLIKTKSDNN